MPEVVLVCRGSASHQKAQKSEVVPGVETATTTAFGLSKTKPHHNLMLFYFNNENPSLPMNGDKFAKNGGQMDYFHQQPLRDTPTSMKIIQKCDLDTLHHTLMSLYEDRIFPGEKILKARLQQQGASDAVLDVVYR